jgi:hypothetical protein
MDKLRKAIILLTGLLLIYPQVANAQITVELQGKQKTELPEYYIMMKLIDTILVKHEGLNFDNYTSVKFEVNRNGNVSNIAFSTYTDSLLMPHITNVLLSTNQHWIIKRNGKAVKKTTHFLLPIVFSLKPKVPLKGPTRESDLDEQLRSSDLVDQSLHIVHFDTNQNRNEGLFLQYRRPEKFEGVVLNPIVVNVPSRCCDPKEREY